jgi:hypothetical protein
MGFDVRDQLLIIFFAFVGCWRKNGRRMMQDINYSDFKKANDSVRREIMYSILKENGAPMKLAMLNKMSLNKTYSGVHIGKYLPDNFPIQNGLK